MAQGVRVLGQQEKDKCNLLIAQTICNFTALSPRGREKVSFCCTILTFFQKGQKNWGKPLYSTNFHYLEFYPVDDSLNK